MGKLYVYMKREDVKKGEKEKRRINKKKKKERKGHKKA